MRFEITKDNVLFLYKYYSYSVKEDEISKKVYGTFKKDWNTYYDEIRDDFSEAMGGKKMLSLLQ